MPIEAISAFIGLILTLLIFSYLIGDNPLFRIAVYIFVGVSAGYVAVVAFWQVLWPDLLRPFFTGTMMQKVTLLIPFVLSGLLLLLVKSMLDATFVCELLEFEARCHVVVAVEGDGALPYPLHELERRGVSRREFMAFCGVLASALALPKRVGAQIAAEIRKAEKPVLVWLEFQDCAGNTEALLRASNPTVAEVVLDVLSLDYHETIMAAAGKQAEEEAF